MSKKLILISGITGFVGSNLKPYLFNKKYTIKGISRKDNQNDEIISYNKCSIDAFSNAYAFIHLAGKAHDLKKTTEDKEYYKVNSELTIDLFDKFLESECKIFIFISTVKAIADKVENVLTEDMTPKPLTTYGKSKLKAEQYILSKKIPINKKVYILRPCMIHGPNNKGNLNLLYKIINKGIPFPLGNFKNQRSFLSIDNLCFIIEKLLSVQPKSNTFNLADDKTLSTNELVKTIGDSINKPIRILKIPKTIIYFLGKIGDILPILPINTEKLHKLTENYVVSNSKIKKVIGELPLTTEEGIRRTINSFQ